MPSMKDKLPILLKGTGTVAKFATVIKMRVKMGGSCQGILDSSKVKLHKKTLKKDHHP
jgi:hypothetical protein